MDNSVIAIIIAGLALIFSFFWNWKIAKITRDHNKLSVKPLFNVQCDTDNNQFRIVAKNVGTGPCIIKKIEYFDLSSKKKTSDMRDLIRHYSPTSPLKELSRRAVNGNIQIAVDGDAIGTNEEIVLFESTGVNFPLNLYYQLFQYGEVTIKFTDIYGKKDTCIRRLVPIEVIEMMIKE